MITKLYKWYTNKNSLKINLKNRFNNLWKQPIYIYIRVCVQTMLHIAKILKVEIYSNINVYGRRI